VLIQKGLLARKQSIDLLDGLDLDFLSVGSMGMDGFGFEDDILLGNNFGSSDADVTEARSEMREMRLPSCSFAALAEGVDAGATAAQLAAASLLDDDFDRDWLRRAALDPANANTRGSLSARSAGGRSLRSLSFIDDDDEVDLSAYESLAASLELKQPQV
jgi:hypothetical protein